MQRQNCRKSLRRKAQYPANLDATDVLNYCQIQEDSVSQARIHARQNPYKKV